MNKEESNEVNLYSQRHYSVDELQYKNFTDKTGIKVNEILWIGYGDWKWPQTKIK